MERDANASAPCRKSLALSSAKGLLSTQPLMERYPANVGFGSFARLEYRDLYDLGLEKLRIRTVESATKTKRGENRTLWRIHLLFVLEKGE